MIGREARKRARTDTHPTLPSAWLPPLGTRLRWVRAPQTLLRRVHSLKPDSPRRRFRNEVIEPPVVMRPSVDWAHPCGIPRGASGVPALEPEPGRRQDRDADARAVGVMVLPGVGFDVVPTDCLALHLASRLPSAKRTDERELSELDAQA